MITQNSFQNFRTICKNLGVCWNLSPVFLSVMALRDRLLSIIQKKHSNLCVAADFVNAADVLRIAEQVGPHICMLKTHCDILVDFSQDFVTSLQDLAKRHDFLIFEDRKFADIGKTVQYQYSAGSLKISQWADVVTVNVLPGSGVIKGLKAALSESELKCRGCLVIAEMSSAGNLATASYTEKAVEIGEEESDFVLGFISQHCVSQKAGMMHFTPGVKLQEGGDNLGQCYLTPQEIVGRRGCDVIIVGRGICQSESPVETAQTYQRIAYDLYEKK